ncbi:DUF7331 family protein [Halocatena salina]|uniref:Bulb-type lectin domain-containing protein n=1 Tax=Halocatena salina TaxID=2934340 RepID=A0A8U0A075_9EURY|nr:hypothetical protein [Halocatena salina]UPM42159.1 hypothetical protein MW046_09315 [Halocatena salina]
MSTRTYDGTNGDDTEQDCIVLELEDGEVVIYDPNNHRAWIQSDVAVEISSQV